MSVVNSLLNWVKQNKLASLLLAVTTYLLFGNLTSRLPGISAITTGGGSSYNVASRESLIAPQAGYGGTSSKFIAPIPGPEYAPTTDVDERMVVAESHMSLLVKNVNQILQAIKDRAENAGGYMVESSVSDPQEAATGRISVRIPQEEFDQTLEYFRSLSIRVVSENLKGTDVTDEYVDIEDRLKILERNKARFETIMATATEIEDILTIQEKIFNLQTQIDNLVGRQRYLQQTAALSKITIYLSTDELALPYAPAQPWRPSVIFRRAVRSLLGNLQNLGTLTIWVGVYSIVWLPALGLIIYYRRRFVKTGSLQTPPDQPKQT